MRVDREQATVAIWDDIFPKIDFFNCLQIFNRHLQKLETREHAIVNRRKKLSIAIVKLM